MITEKDFDYFLINGFIEGLNSETSLNTIIDRFGNDSWTVKETENNGLIYGIIMVGMTEFHIYNEKLNGISFKPYAFDKTEFDGIKEPWISGKIKLKEITTELNIRKIQFQKYSVIGPKTEFKTAGVELHSLENGKHTFIDTEGGVTFLFDTENEAYQVCKYYNLK
jgi:hypothetical protein